ncbi:MAG: acyl carrier protein [Gemmatimonadaceae bacterium]
MDDIRSDVREYILDKFLPGEDPEALTDSTPLVTTAILDSLATVQLVSFLEERYGIRIAAHEASVDNLNTIDLIVALVESKR